MSLREDARAGALPAPTSYTRGQRVTAAAYGLACHVSFALAVATMAWSLFVGLQHGRGRLGGWAAVAADVGLVLQFGALHSFLLSERGRRLLACLAPAALGRDLVTTTYATIASWQLLATFGLWSPSGVVWWQPAGGWLAVATVAYAASWLLLLKAMADAGLALQTGFLGWGAVVRGQAPRYGMFPQHGLFALLRQPIYLAFTLTLWTAPCWTPDRFALAIGWTVYCLVGPLLKERRYRAWYGAAFEQYRRRVPYWLPRPPAPRPTGVAAAADVVLSPEG